LKIRIIIVLLLLCVLTGCGSVNGTVSSRSDSAVNAAIKEEDKAIKNVFAYIETGAYQDAETVIQEKIIGNISIESKATQACLAYSDALYADYNTGKATEEEISTITQTAAMTSFADQICNSDWQAKYYELQASKESFNQASGYADSGDKTNAVVGYCAVIPTDANYTDAIMRLNEIASSMENAEGYEDTKTLINVYETIMNAINNSTDLQSKLDYSIIESNYLKIKQQFAVALEADGQYYYALQQFAQLKFNYSLCSDEYDELAWKLNQNGYYYSKPQSEDYYEISQSDGTVTKYGEELIWNIGGSNIAQVSYDYKNSGSFYGTLLGVLDRNGNISVSLGKSVSDNEAYSAQEMAQNEKGITWIKAYYGSEAMGIVGLRCDGTIAICGSMMDDYDILELAAWTNIIKLLPWGDGYLGLTTDGRVLQSSSAHGDFSGWIDVVSICHGSMSRFLDNHSEDAVFGLTKQGVVLHTEYFDTNDQIGDAVSIAAEFYLNSDGTIHSVSAPIEELLNRNYGDMKFEFLVNNTCIKNYGGDVAMAYTTDGRWIRIDI